jgi:L-ascorbate metabolism protein UlaG (beta-lactamase superfamily)
MDGSIMLIDPMFSDVPAPHPWLGSKRFSDELPIEIENLPKIDAVIISHDHYDHLDYASIVKLKDKVDAYFVPLGVGVHLEAWGISSAKIHEKDWWEVTAFKNIQLTCTPAQHFSGRKFNNPKSTLWSSWVITSKDANIYFSGDSGYGKHFRQIGENYGPFDLALIECGQYNAMWPDIHMFPDESAQAGLDLKAKALMPIHWGAFKLSTHAWTEPILQIRKKAHALGLPIVSPKIGAPIRIDKLPEPSSVWW